MMMMIIIITNLIALHNYIKTLQATANCLSTTNKSLLAATTSVSDLSRNIYAYLQIMS